MKKVYIIGGTMGVGKTTVCQMLKFTMEKAVFLDGDWCWDPRIVTEETKRMVKDNICHILNSFIHCSEYKNILFCWVMHEQSIIDDIIKGLDTENVMIRTISLTCDTNSLEERLREDILTGVRKADVLPRSLDRLPMYDELDTLKIDTSYLMPDEVAELIAHLA